MHFSTIVAPLFLAAAAVAQSTAASGQAAPSQAPSGGAATPSGSVMVQVVKVGGNNGELKFEPEDIQAKPGSMVQFQFYPKNHSVAQSTFNQPCQPMSQNMPNGQAANELWSGFMPTQPNAQMMATWTIMVNDTTPIWLYCAQAKHCQSGMVAAINAQPTGAKTLSAFKQLAAKAATNVAPNGGMGGPGAANGTGSPAAAGQGGSNTGGSPAAASSPAASGNVKSATGAASTVTFTSSTMVLAGLLSVFVANVL